MWRSRVLGKNQFHVSRADLCVSRNDLLKLPQASIVINLVNNTAQEVTTVVFAQVANRKMRQEKFVALTVQSLKQSENCFVNI